MDLVCVGISHHTAPVEVRERLWFSDEEIRTALPELKQFSCSEAVLFSTCNRTELYAYTETSESRIDELKNFLIARKSASPSVSSGHLFSYTSDQAAEHLYRVASGIDSMVVGDVQILAQVREGFRLAVDGGSAHFFMQHLFQSASHVGKRSRSESQIGEGAVSVSYAAVELAERIFADLKKKTALVIGAGETAQLTAQHLRGKEIGRLLITNRTAEKARQLAESLNGETLPFDCWQESLPRADIVVSAVEVPNYILSAEGVKAASKKHGANALFLIDLGVPRNIDPAARDFENVFLYDMDNLQSMVDENLQKRKSEIPKIESIVASEVKELVHWHTSLQANPTISALTELMERIRKEEVEKNLNRFDQKDRELLELVTKRIVNKILHAPIVNLKNGQDETLHEKQHTLHAIRKLFGLKREAKESMHGG
jgi:glutamyl-tRNA reductase